MLKEKPETLSDWFYRTDIERRTNFKSDYRTPSELELSKQRKAELKKQKQDSAPHPFNYNNNNNNVEEDAPLDNIPPAQDNVKKVIHAPHKHGSKKLRPEHIKDVKNILLNAGYTQAVQHSLNLSAGLKKVFIEIHEGTFAGVMDPVIRLIQSLGGFVDETRSGSRIGFVLRHVNTSEIVGTDMLSPGDETQPPSEN